MSTQNHLPMLELSDIIESIHSATGIHPVTCRVIARHLFDGIRYVLEAQEPVSIPDFGKFSFKQRKATIHENVNGGPSTYSPANSRIVFKPEVHWESWQRIHSSIIPDQLPPGTVLGARLSKSHRVKSEYPDMAATNTSSFYNRVIVPKAIRKQNQSPTIQPTNDQ